MKYQILAEKILASEMICFLGSLTAEGYPMVRAMLKPIKISGADFYLHTNSSSKKIQQFLADDRACLYFCSPENYEGLALTGRLTVINSGSEKLKFWQEDYQVYYEKGGGIADFTVLKFTADKGEHYHDLTVAEV